MYCSALTTHKSTVRNIWWKIFFSSGNKASSLKGALDLEQVFQKENWKGE